MPEIRERLQKHLSGSYTLGRELTGGGMSRVFVAEERALNRKVVIKVLSPALAAAVSVERFEREIMVLAGLNHPNVVPVLSAGQIAGLPYLIMPFVKFNQTDSSCTSDCTLSGIDFKWMRRVSGVWQEATAEEVELVVGSSGGYISLRLGTDDSSKGVGFTIPATSVTGTIAWDAANANLAGATSEDLAAATAEELCHFGLSYDDKLGMRIFAGISNAPGTCASP